MPNSQSKIQKTPNKADQPSHSDAHPSPAGAHCTSTFSQPIQPSDVSWAANEGLSNSSSPSSDEDYEYIDANYEKAEEDVAGKLHFAQSSLYWKAVGHLAVWRPKPNPRNTGSNKAKPSGSSIPKTKGRVLAAEVNMGPLSSGNMIIDRANEAPKPDDEKPHEYFSYASSVSSFSSCKSILAEIEGQEIISTMKLDELWTHLEAPDVDDNWDMISEADRFRDIATRPTFNSLMRERLEAMKAERARVKQERSGA